MATPPPGYPAGYPSHRVAAVLLADGSTVRIRPVIPEDAASAVDLFARMSPASRFLRFHGDRTIGGAEARHFVDVDYRDRMGLIAEVGVETPSAVGLASYVRTRGGR